MNTALDFHRAEAELEAYVDEVPKVGTYVVRDGDIYQEDDLSRLLDVVAADIRRGDASPQLWAAHVAWTEASR
jgi:hypothetical protein